MNKDSRRRYYPLVTCVRDHHIHCDRSKHVSQDAVIIATVKDCTTYLFMAIVKGGRMGVTSNMSRVLDDF